MPLTRALQHAAPVSLDVTAVRAVTDPLLALVGPPAGKALSGAQRRALGGRLFSDAPRLARLVAQGIGARPDLFPDLPITGAGLAALQAQADGWRELRDCLRYLSEQAGDRFLLAQGAAVDQTLTVLRQVTDSAALPFPCGLPDPKDREVALGEALALQRRVQRQRRGRALKALRAGADASPTSGGRPRRAPTPRRTQRP